MNTLGLWVVAGCVPVTLFALLGVIVHTVVRRRGPAVGALATATTLIILTGVSLLTVSSWPHWWTLGVPIAWLGEKSPAVATNTADLLPDTQIAADVVAPDGPAEDGSSPPSVPLSASPQHPPVVHSDRVPRTVAAATWHWPGLVGTIGIVFATGGSVALIRFLLGLWMVSRYRACSVVITEPALMELARQIASDLGLNRPVELRQSCDLGSPATVGWWRPLVLLPVGWEMWSAAERRVVLAHEIAHIARCDFPVWLLAQVSLALHFYHPLVHWLVRRLRLEQELAADVLGAHLAGGRELYLVTLTRMVLRKDARRTGWAAQPFLPSRGTFLRRIEMLSENKSLGQAHWSRRSVAALVAVMALLGLASAGVRMPSGEPTTVVSADESRLVAGDGGTVGDKASVAKSQKAEPDIGAATKPGKGTPPPPANAPFDAEQARKHQAVWAKYLGVPVEYTNSLGMKFVLVPPGEFTMGSTPREIEEDLDHTKGQEAWIISEGPRHRVIVTQPVYFGVHEVTQGEYQKVIGKNPSSFSNFTNQKDTSRQPVENLSWNDATEFCVKLSEQENLKPCYVRQGQAMIPATGVGYRLPSEAEWELSCRAGTITKYWLGDDSLQLASIDWIANNSKYKGPTDVGRFKANPFGIKDLHGNVSEWVEDWWDPEYYQQFLEQPAIDPRGPPTSAKNRRVSRGGNWYTAAVLCRTAHHRAFKPSDGYDFQGFRVVLSPFALVQPAPSGQARKSAGTGGDKPPVAAAKPTEKPPTLDELRTIVMDQIRSIRSLHLTYTKTEPAEFGGESQDHVWAEQGFKLLKRIVPNQTASGYAESFDGKRTYQLGQYKDQPGATTIRDEFDEHFYLSVSSSLIGWLHTSDHRESIINAIRSPSAKLVSAKDGDRGPTIEVPDYRRTGADSYALHVTLVLDREHGYLPCSITYHGVTNPTWKFAHEVDQFVKVRDAATRTDRWFPSHERYFQRTPERGEQVFTSVVKKVTINEPLPDDMFVLSADLPAAAPGQEEQALADFEKAYRLAPGQLVKHIKRPYLPGRILNYKKWWAGAFAQSDYKTTGMFLPAVFPERDGKLEQPSFHFTSGYGENVAPASEIINALTSVALKLRYREIDDPDKFLEKKVAGDFVVRADAPLDKLIPAFGQVLQNECDVPVTLEFREIEHPVMVVSGKIKPPFVIAPETVIELYTTSAQPGQGENEQGTFGDFLKAVGQHIDPKRRIINDVENSPYRQEKMSWHRTVRTGKDDQAPLDEADARAVLDHLEKQTGLKFKLESRKFPTIFVTRSE